MPGRPKVCVERRSTYVCVINGFGAFACPTNAEGSPPLANENATTDGRGVLRLEVPSRRTHATPPLPWQRRYPHVDGWIEPWTSSGKLRPGLRFAIRYSGGGSCSRGSEQTVAKAAVRCFWVVRSAIVDPCFPQRAEWRHRGAVLACATAPGRTVFGRFVITKRA